MSGESKGPTIPAQFVTYGKLISAADGPILPGSEHAVTSRSAKVESDVHNLLPASLLGGQILEPRHVEAKELKPGGADPPRSSGSDRCGAQPVTAAILGQATAGTLVDVAMKPCQTGSEALGNLDESAKLAECESPDGALLVRQVEGMSCLTGSRRGVALMRFRFRPERGEGRGGRPYLQATTWLVAYDDWCQHAGAILSYATMHLRADPDPAPRNKDGSLQRTTALLEQLPKQIVLGDWERWTTAMVRKGEFAQPRDRASFVRMFDTLHSAREITNEFGGNLFDNEAQFLTIAGRMFDWLCLMKRPPANFSISSRIRFLTGPGPWLRYLPSATTPPFEVDWEAWLASIWPPAPPPRQAQSTQAASKMPGNPMPVPDSAIAGRSLPGHGSSGASAAQRPTYYVSSGAAAGLKLLLDQWAGRFHKYATGVTRDDPIPVTGLVLASRFIADHLVNNSLFAIDSDMFQELRVEAQNALRLFLSAWDRAGYKVAGYASNFSFREICALALALKYIKEESSPGDDRDRVQTRDEFVRGTISLLTRRIINLDVLWPAELEVHDNRGLDSARYYMDMAKYGEITPWKQVNDVVRRSHEFNAAWRPWGETRSPNGNRIGEGEHPLLADACRRLLVRISDVTKVPVKDYPRTADLPTLLMLGSLDKDRPLNSATEAERHRARNLCTKILQEARQEERRTPEPVATLRRR